MQNVSRCNKLTFSVINNLNYICSIIMFISEDNNIEGRKNFHIKDNRGSSAEAIVKEKCAAAQLPPLNP